MNFLGEMSVPFFEMLISPCPLTSVSRLIFCEVKSVKPKTKGVLILGLVLAATIAMLCVFPASAAMNGDADQMQDRLQDKAQDGSCGFDCQQDLTQLRTRLQIRDCLSAP